MGNSTYPYASTATAPYSTQPPVTASSVLLDGQLVGTGSYTTNVTGSGAPWLLYANGASNATFTIGGASYTVTPGSTVGTAAISGSTSVTVASDTLAGTPGAANTGSGGTTSQRYACAFGNNIFVQIGPSISNGGATTVAY